jgi:hypothetical protein
MSKNANFDPNRREISHCEAVVNGALALAGADSGGFLTSRDQFSNRLRDLLRTTNIPDDEQFEKWQLPFIIGDSAWFITVAKPSAVTPAHRHTQGPGVRVILSGALTFNGEEYHSGDWLYVPKDMQYEYTAGALGVIVLSCYQCCTRE